MTGHVRLLSRVAMVGLLVVAGFAVMSAPNGLVSSAHASCYGSGNLVPIDSYIGTDLVARETAVAGTCNGDGTYRGNIGDRRAGDGWCALALFRDAGVVSTQGIDCTADNGPVEYSFNDRNGDRRAEIKVCFEGSCANFHWIPINGY
jgi:hypothetical protein